LEKRAKELKEPKSKKGSPQKKKDFDGDDSDISEGEKKYN
jgi:hypothetical protein